MPTELTSLYQDTFPILPLQSLRRPLSDREKLEIWKAGSSGLSQEALNELEGILQNDDEQYRELVEACISFLILRAMQAHTLQPKVGHIHRLTDSLTKAVNRFNRYIR